MRARVIPVLLLSNGELIKTTSFKKPNYIGDPINTIKLFNDMDVDEIIVLDISAGKNRHGPNIELIQDMASECFIPMGYGGGITSVDQMTELFKAGVEKVSVNFSALRTFEILREAIARFGSQSIVVSVDVKKNLFGKYVIYNHVTKSNEKLPLESYIKQLNELPVGEILINSVDQDGKMSGYDLELTQMVAAWTTVPLITCGGAGEHDDLKRAIDAKADAAAAGSLFIYQNKERGILVNYPTQNELDEILGIKAGDAVE